MRHHRPAHAITRKLFSFFYDHCCRQASHSLSFTFVNFPQTNEMKKNRLGFSFLCADRERYFRIPIWDIRWSLCASPLPHVFAIFHGCFFRSSHTRDNKNERRIYQYNFSPNYFPFTRACCFHSLGWGSRVKYWWARRRRRISDFFVLALAGKRKRLGFASLPPSLCDITRSFWIWNEIYDYGLGWEDTEAVSVEWFLSFCPFLGKPRRHRKLCHGSRLPFSMLSRNKLKVIKKRTSEQFAGTQFTFLVDKSFPFFTPHNGVQDEKW